jgi:hypothetical protein
LIPFTFAVTLMKKLLADFLTPATAFRGKPFWSWNGELDETELLRQIHVFKEMGFGGFFMHSRTGLSTEYLGDEWFRLTNLCADEAAKLGMEAWLYDEDRWPSGTAGGLVTQNPVFRQQFVSARQIRPADFNWDDQILAAFAATVDGLNLSDCKRLVRNDIPEADRTVLVFRIEHAAESSFYNGNTYVDTLSRAATDAYLDMTHEQYRARCGNRLGSIIQGIFTDEPHRGPVMNGFSLSNANRLWMTPWTETLVEEFRAAFGYDLAEHLPELFFRLNGEPVAPVKWQYMELLQQLFLRNFAKPMFDWCNQHNMQLTGHVLHEDTLTAQACMQGSLARFYEFMHVPGIDILGEGNRSYWVAKQLSSVARQLGQKWMLSELYGCTGWQMGFDGHKAVGDWQALFGINVRCHHLAWYTMQGEAKRDYPASISHQSAWWKDYRYVEDYFARMGTLLAHGQPCAGILAVTPIESIWCQIHGGWAENLAAKDESVKSLESAYADLFTWLTGSQAEFDYGDEEMMSRLARVTHRADGKPVIRFGEAEYTVILLGRMTTIRSSTLHLLEEFAAAGGQIIFAGEPPTYVDAVRSSGAASLADRVTRVAWDQSAIVRACRSASDIRVEITRDDGSNAPQVFCQLRCDESGNIVMAVLNTDREKGISGARLRLIGSETDAAVAEWDCATSQRFACPAQRTEQNQLHWTTDLAPGGSRAFIIGSSADAGLRPRPRHATIRRRELDQSFRFELTEPNVCVLDMPQLQIDDGPWQPAAEMLKVDRMVRTAFGLQWRSGEMVQPWFRRRTDPHRPVKGTVRLRFNFTIEKLPSTAIELALEQPQSFRAQLNSTPIGTGKQDIVGWWVDHSIHRVRIPMHALCIGSNKLELETDFHEDINLEALYLLGDFGVRVDGAHVTLTAMPTALNPADITTQGLPFYGGGIRYHLPIPPNQKMPLLLELPNLGAACAKVVRDGAPAALIAWHPYRVEVTDLIANNELTLEVTLTRRNTFGPLHQLPLMTPYYGPGNFTTEGNKWSDPFVLFASGLLAAPVLVEVEGAPPMVTSPASDRLTVNGSVREKRANRRPVPHPQPS